MTRETTNRQVQEMYPDSDGATKRDLEGLANSISQFRAAVHHIAGREGEGLEMGWRLDQAQERRQTAHRRIVLEWAIAAVLCVTMLVPAVGYYRSHAAQEQARQKEQLLKQREADTALLDQVTSALSETEPDSMRPLAEMDTDYASYQTAQTEKKNDRN